MYKRVKVKGNGPDKTQTIQFIVTIVTFVSIIYKGNFHGYSIRLLKVMVLLFYQEYVMKVQFKYRNTNHKSST